MRKFYVRYWSKAGGMLLTRPDRTARVWAPWSRYVYREITRADAAMMLRAARHEKGITARRVEGENDA